MALTILVLVVGALVPAVVWVRQSSWGRLLGIAPPPESVWIDEERKTVPPYELPPAPDPNAIEVYDQGTAALGEPASIGELAREEPWVEEWRQGIARGEYESLTPHLPKVRDIHESNTEALALLHEARGMDAANTQPPDYQADRGYLAERRELARAAATAIQLYSVEGRYDEALSVAADTMWMGAVQCEGDGILTMLVGGAIVAIADWPTRSMLLFGEPSREALLEYARWMRKTRDAVPPLSEVIHYDAVESLGALERMKARTAGKGSVSRVMQGQAEEGRVWLEDRYARLIEAADEPYWEGAFAEIADRTEANSDALDNVTASILAPLAEDFQSSHRAMLNQFIAHELMSAIEAYHLDHDSYPDDLDALAPDYLPDIPVDRFTGEDLIYEPSPDGYLLYSPGADGVDDGGLMERNLPGRGDPDSVYAPLWEPVSEVD